MVQVLHVVRYCQYQKLNRQKHTHKHMYTYRYIYVLMKTYITYVYKFSFVRFFFILHPNRFNINNRFFVLFNFFFFQVFLQGQGSIFFSGGRLTTVGAKMSLAGITLVEGADETGEGRVAFIGS